MRQVGRLNLHRDRVADRRRRGAGLVRRPAEGVAGQRHFGTDQGLRRRDRRHDAGCAGQIDAGQRGSLPDHLFRAPGIARLAILDQASHRLDRRVGATHHRHVDLAQALQRRVRGRHPADDEGFLRRHLDLGEQVDQQIRIAFHQLQPHDGDIDRRVFEHRVDAVQQDFRLGQELPGNVDRVSRRAEGRDRVLQRRRCVRRKLRHLEAELLRPVCHQDPGATGLRHDADAAPGGQVGVGQRLHQVEHMLLIAAAQDAELAHDPVEDRVLAGQRSGVRGRRARAGAEAADLGQHQRLFLGHRLLGQRDEPLAILQSFDIAGADGDAGIVEHRRHAGHEIHIRLVARIDEQAEAHMPVAGERVDRGAESTRLRHEGDGAGRRFRVGILAEGCHRAFERVDQTQTVRPADADAAVARRRRDLRFERLALRAHLAEAGAEDHRAGDLRLAELPDRIQDEFRRHRHDGQIGRFRQLEHRRVTLDPGDLVIFRVHRIDRARIALVEQELHRPAVQLVEVRGDPDDGDRSRAQHALQRVTHTLSPKFRGGRRRGASDPDQFSAGPAPR